MLKGHLYRSLPDVTPKAAQGLDGVRNRLRNGALSRKDLRRSRDVLTFDPTSGVLVHAGHGLLPQEQATAVDVLRFSQEGRTDDVFGCPPVLV